MHHGTKREIRREGEWRGLGRKRLEVVEIGSSRAEEGALNFVKCREVGKMLK
jgi:hypothetical protein